MLPGRSRLTEQFDASAAQFLDSRRQVTDREPDDRPAIKVLPALVERAEDLDIPAVGELEDPQARFGVLWPQSEHVLVEVRELPIMFGTGTAPAQARDVHACQYRCQPDCASSPVGDAASAAKTHPILPLRRGIELSADQILGEPHDQVVIHDHLHPLRRGP
jgi:hypothetical protein